MMHKHLWPEATLSIRKDKESDSDNENLLVFLTTPFYLERLVSFGFLLCLDCFIFYLTILPIRFIISILCLGKKIIFKTPKQHIDSFYLFDIIRGFVLCISCLVLYCIDTSVVYHNLRGQSIIKSYVIYNMLEIIEKLMTSLGQDIYKASFRYCYRMGVQEPSEKINIFILFLYMIIFAGYTIFHGFLILCQAVILNIAMNSHNMALLTIMISNQFVELKGNVFRKFEEANLFQLACSDIRERLHVSIFLIVIIVRNLDQFAWNLDYFLDILPGILLIFFSEWVLDWMKHAFIAKFNSIQSKFYQKCSKLISDDLNIPGIPLSIITDHSMPLCKRMGLLCLPLECVVCKIILESGTILQQSKLIITLSIGTAFVCKFLLGYWVVWACKSKPVLKQRRTLSTTSEISINSTISEPEEIHSSKVYDSIQEFPEDMQHSLRNRNPDTSTKSQKKALKDVGRFTLCSNAIV